MYYYSGDSDWDLYEYSVNGGRECAKDSDNEVIGGALGGSIGSSLGGSFGGSIGGSIGGSFGGSHGGSLGGSISGGNFYSNTLV